VGGTGDKKGVRAEKEGEVRECLKRRHAQDGASSSADGVAGDAAAPALQSSAAAQKPAQTQAAADLGPVWNGDTNVALRRDDPSTYHALSSETYGLAPAGRHPSLPVLLSACTTSHVSLDALEFSHLTLQVFV
jgi:hypothetical protein